MKRLISIVFILALMVGSCKKNSDNGNDNPDNPDPPLPTDAVILTFTADPASIQAGKETTLSWSTLRATDISIDQGVGKVSDQGTRRVKPNKTTTYTLTAKGANNTATKSVTVNVTQPPPDEHASIRSFTASKTNAAAYETITISWETWNAITASISGIGSVELLGNLSRKFSDTTTLTLTATGKDNQPVTASVTVNIDKVSPCTYISLYSYAPTDPTHYLCTTSTNKSTYYTAHNVVVQAILYDNLNNIIETASETISSIGPGQRGEVTLYLSKGPICDHSTFAVIDCRCDFED